MNNHGGLLLPLLLYAYNSGGLVVSHPPPSFYPPPSLFQSYFCVFSFVLFFQSFEIAAGVPCGCANISLIPSHSNQLSISASGYAFSKP